MAYVLIQHLDPNYKSVLTDIISKYTKMKIYEAVDGMKVKQNCVYIIPPNRIMKIENGILLLFELSSFSGRTLPIDYFLHSLAVDQHEMATCIILSGTGTDGTLGLKSIKSEGGLVIAQLPDSSEYSGMPISAISTGLVDFILTPEDIGKTLISYYEHSSKPLITTGKKLQEDTHEVLKNIFKLLYTHTSHDFSNYKPNTVNRRIERRLAVNQTHSLSEYYSLLKTNPKEIELLFHDLLIGVTNFFRDKEEFDYIEEKIIPRIFEEKPDGATIRLWSVGCSTGEEAYSLAILLYEYIEKHSLNHSVKIFATDIDNYAIAQARSGIYSKEIENDISPKRLKKHFKLNLENGLYQIKQSIRDMLIFSEQNVIKDPPFSSIDLITCRNLMIYFNNDLQRKIIPVFHYSLNNNGTLFLGNAESISEY